MARWDPEDVVKAFRRVRLVDLRSGKTRTLAQYERIFPGFEAVIAAEFAAAAAEDAPPSSGAPSAPLVDSTGTAARPDASAGQDHAIGPYRVVRELGRGAQATVYLAEDTRLPRRVALKVFNTGMGASAQMLARFRREAESASRLDHPGICTVFDAGVDGATPWIAMRYVDGRTLADWIETTRAKHGAAGRSSSVDLPLRRDGDASPGITRVVALFEMVARTLHVAHESGLVHRDVKPGNVMVTPEAEPVILDFGLATWDDDGQHLTLTGTVLGTPSYMSPEQIVAERGRIDRRTDVYSLGVTLYESLTLRLPFSAPTREGLFHQVLSGVVESPRRANPRIPADLELVVATAMDRDRDRRYQTALDLAEDLRRVLVHQPLRARPTPGHVRLAQWMRRHPALATAAIAAFVMLAAGLVSAMYHLRESRAGETKLLKALDDKTAALRRARSLALVAASADAARSDPERAVLLAREAVRLDPLPPAVQELHRALHAHREIARWQVRPFGSPAASFSPDGSRVLLVAPDHTCRIADLHGTEVASLAGHDDVVTCATWSDDGRRIASASHDGSVRVWDADGRPLSVLAAEGERFERVAFLPGSASVFAVSVRYLAGDPAPVRIARVWDAAGSEVRRLDLGPAEVRDAAAAPRADGSAAVVLGSGDGAVRIWDAASGAVVLVRAGGSPVVSVAVRPDGERFFVATTDGRAVTWSIDGSGETALPGDPHAQAAVFGPDGTGLVLASTIDVAVLDSAGRIAATAKGHDLPVSCVAVARRGDRIASGAADRTVRVWTPDGRELLVLRGHADSVRSVAFAPDGAHALSVSDDGTARLWEVRPREVAALVGAVHCAAFGSDGTRVLLSCEDGTARLRDLASARETVLRGHTAVVRSAVFSPGGDRIVTASEDGTAKVWKVDGETVVAEATLAGHKGPVWRAVFSPAGDRIVTCGNDMTARVWTPGGEQVAVLRGHTYDVLGAAFLPGGTRIVTSGLDTSVRVWDLAGKELAQFRGHTGPVTSVVLSPRGDRMLTASADHTARLWDLSGKEVAILRGHTGTVKHAAFDPSGDRIVTASDDRTVRLWDLSGRETLRLQGHAHWVWSVEFSADGRRVVSASQDGSALVWAVSVGEILSIADRRLSRGFTVQEREEYGALLEDGAR